jgi:hypothetical protein
MPCSTLAFVSATSALLNMCCQVWPHEFEVMVIIMPPDIAISTLIIYNAQLCKELSNIKKYLRI